MVDYHSLGCGVDHNMHCTAADHAGTAAAAEGEELCAAAPEPHTLSTRLHGYFALSAVICHKSHSEGPPMLQRQQSQEACFCIVSSIRSICTMQHVKCTDKAVWLACSRQPATYS